jgi:glycerol-3-phosphate acyltransferase PlsY
LFRIFFVFSGAIVAYVLGYDVPLILIVGLTFALIFAMVSNIEAINSHRRIIGLAIISPEARRASCWEKVASVSLWYSAVMSAMIALYKKDDSSSRKFWINAVAGGGRYCGLRHLLR